MKTYKYHKVISQHLSKYMPDSKIVYQLLYSFLLLLFLLVIIIEMTIKMGGGDATHLHTML